MMNPLDYVDSRDEIFIFDKMKRMAMFIDKLIEAVNHLRAENEELKAKVGDDSGK